MPSEALRPLVAALRADPVLTGDTIPELRATMERMTGLMPLPDDARFEAVDAGGVAAEWTSVPESRAGHAIVYLHGGAYALGSPKTHRGLVARLARAARARVLSVDYRLAPEHPHPAAVEDACAAWRFVRDDTGPLERATLAGDSAGGGLAVAALVALRDAGEALPAAAACLSPWLDLSLSGDSVKDRALADPVVEEGKLRMMASAYLAGTDPRDPTASPLFADLRDLPPLLVQVGSAEILLDDARRFAQRATAAGVDCQLEVWPDMIHVWHAFADALPEGREAVERVATFLEPDRP